MILFSEKVTNYMEKEDFRCIRHVGNKILSHGEAVILRLQEVEYVEPLNYAPLYLYKVKINVCIVLYQIFVHANIINKTLT